MRLGEGGRLPDRDERAAARRLRAGLEAKRARGFTEDDLGSSAAAEIEADVRIPGAARRHVHASLRAGRSRPGSCAASPTRASVAASSSTSDRRRRRSSRGACDLRAARSTRRIVVRATEAFTTRLPGERPQLPPARLAHARDGAAARRRPGTRSAGRVARRSPISATSSPTPSERRTGASRSAAAASRTGSAARSARPTRHRPRSTASSSRRSAGSSRRRRRCRSAIAGAVSSPRPATGAWRSPSIARPASRAPAVTRATASSRRASPDARSRT